MKSIPSTRASDGYKIIVRGQLSEEWLQEFQGLRLSSDGEFTTRQPVLSIRPHCEDCSAACGISTWF